MSFNWCIFTFSKGQVEIDNTFFIFDVTDRSYRRTDIKRYFKYLDLENFGDVNFNFIITYINHKNSIHFMLDDSILCVIDDYKHNFNTDSRSPFILTYQIQLKICDTIISVLKGSKISCTVFKNKIIGVLYEFINQ